MRNPSNETPALKAVSPESPARGPRKGGKGAPRAASSDAEIDGPTRKCILSGEHDGRDHLIRLAISPDGEVLPDVRAKALGRGAWIGVTRSELEAAMAKGKLRGALARAFKGAALQVPQDLPERIATQLERNLLDRLGLESRAGALVTGGEKLDKAARSGRLELLLHASDAGADGAARLAQAWRVGSDREGSGLRGLTLPLPRTILSLALGRENVVHAGLTDAKAAKRVSEALNRWLHFIGPEPLPEPCVSSAQGASALTSQAPYDDERQTEGL